MRLLILLLIIAGSPCLVFSEEPFTESDSGTTADRVIPTDGDQLIPFSVSINSTSATSVYRVFRTTHTTDYRQHRKTVIINPSSTYDLLVSTWQNFDQDNDHWFFVPKGSGTWSTRWHQEPWFKYVHNAPTTTVRGYISRQRVP